MGHRSHTGRIVEATCPQCGRKLLVSKGRDGVTVRDRHCTCVLKPRDWTLLAASARVGGRR